MTIKVELDLIPFDQEFPLTIKVELAAASSDRDFPLTMTVSLAAVTSDRKFPSIITFPYRYSHFWTRLRVIPRTDLV